MLQQGDGHLRVTEKHSTTRRVAESNQSQASYIRCYSTMENTHNRTTILRFMHN